MLGLVLLVLFVHFGGPNVPKVLKDNKQMVYGVTIGLVLCSFFGVNVEGMVGIPDNSLYGNPEQRVISCIENKCDSGSPPPYCQCLRPDYNSFDTNLQSCLNTLVTPQEFSDDYLNCL